MSPSSVTSFYNRADYPSLTWGLSLMQSVTEWMMWKCHTQFYTLFTFTSLLANPPPKIQHFHNITSTCVVAHSTSSLGTASPASSPGCVTVSTKTITLHHQNTVIEKHTAWHFTLILPNKCISTNICGVGHHLHNIHKQTIFSKPFTEHSVAKVHVCCVVKSKNSSPDAESSEKGSSNLVVI